MRRPEEVLVFVRRGAEFLVLHRSPGRGAYWHCVAGALEQGEDHAEAAARELREETGLVAEPLEVGGDCGYLLEAFPEYRDVLPTGTRGILVRNFLADAPQGWEPRLDFEHDDYVWLAAAEAADLLFWPEPAALLRSL